MQADIMEDAMFSTRPEIEVTIRIQDAALNMAVLVPIVKINGEAAYAEPVYSWAEENKEFPAMIKAFI